MSLTTNIENIYKNGVIGNVRKAQEDSHDMALQTPNGDVFVVCDGMGGHVGGAKASSLAVESILAYMKKEQYANPIEALNNALQYANMQILNYANEHPELRGMGTTACIVLMQGNDVWIAHVGDSRIYLYLGKENELHRITKDHSFVQTLVDAGQISDEDAELHPQKNRILKALGIKPELQPTFNYNNQPIHPKNGDIFLICSDGLSGMIPDSTIKNALRQNMSISDRGDLLIQLAMQGETVQPGGQDNCTVELIKIDNSPWQKSEFKSYNPLRASKPAPVVNVPTPAYNSGNGDEPKKKGGKKKIIIIAIVVLLVLGLGGFGIYKFVSSRNEGDKLVEEKMKPYQDYCSKIKLYEDSLTKANGKLNSCNLEARNDLNKKCVEYCDSIISYCDMIINGSADIVKDVKDSRVKEDIENQYKKIQESAEKSRSDASDKKDMIN